MKRYIKSAISSLLDEHWQAKEEIASNPNTDIEVLRLLATDTDSVVKMDVASNPNTPVDLLPTLATDEDEIVRWGVTQNPNVPIELLHQLCEDANWEVVEGVTENDKVPTDILRNILSRLDFNNRKYWNRYQRNAYKNAIDRLISKGEVEKYQI